MKNLFAFCGLLFGITWTQSALAQDYTAGTYTLLMRPAASFFNATPIRQDVLRIGVLKMDGYGNASGRITATSIDNTGATWIIDFNFTGPYTLHPDGTGYLKINPTAAGMVCQNSTTIPVTPVACPVGVEPSQLFAFVFGFNHFDSKEIFLTEVSNVNAGTSKVFLTGVAKLQ
jgi:hypothetical protein